MSEALMDMWVVPQDLEAALEDVRKSRKNHHSVIFLEFAASSADFFFCTEPSCTNGTVRQTSLEARGMLSTVHITN